MAGHDKRGRTVGEPRHLRLYQWLTSSPAWRSLDPYERALYLEFKQRYNGVNNGGIVFSGEEMAAALNCSNRPADRARNTLIERGFIKVTKRGSFDWKTRGEGGSRASCYLLTEHSVDLPERSAMPPSKEFMRWRPEEKTRGEHVTRMGCSRHPIKADMGCSRHPNGASTSPLEGEILLPDGVSTSPAYNIPEGSGADEARKRPANPKGQGAQRAADPTRQADIDAIHDAFKSPGDPKRSEEKRFGKTIDHDPAETGPRSLGDIIIDLDFWRTVKAEAARVEIDEADAWAEIRSVGGCA